MEYIFFKVKCCSFYSKTFTTTATVLAVWLLRVIHLIHLTTLHSKAPPANLSATWLINFFIFNGFYQSRCIKKTVYQNHSWIDAFKINCSLNCFVPYWFWVGPWLLKALWLILSKSLTLAVNKTKHVFFTPRFKFSNWAIFRRKMQTVQTDFTYTQIKKTYNLGKFVKCFLSHQGASQLTMVPWCASDVPPCGRR